MRLGDRLLNHLETVLCLGIARIALSTLPFAWIHDWLNTSTTCGRVQHRLNPQQPRLTGQSIARWSHRCLWASTCLTKALAARSMLRRKGHATTLRIGFAIDESGQMKAHAWLFCGGYTVTGGPVEDDYRVLHEYRDILDDSSGLQD